jgi:Gpi18-like mannosyltransferase
MDMKNKKHFFTVLSLLLMFSMGLALRVMFLPANTIDMEVSNVRWYEYIVEHGRFNAMGDLFADYTPPYLYLLSLATLTESFLPKLTAVKLIPVVFDLINVVLVYQIAKKHFDTGAKPMFAAMTYWVLPTIMINSAFWGQADSIYVCFILLCVLFLLEERWVAAVVAFSISFTIKAQAVFILPLLAVFFFKKKIAWHTFLLMPLVYFVSILPAWLAGRSMISLVFAYLGQADRFKFASKNAANFYFFLPHGAYQAAILIGFPLAALLLLVWSWSYGTKHDFRTPRTLILAALVSVALVPFLFPKMHDRYFYPADTFSLIAAFFIPELWFVPIAYQVISTLSYLPFLFGVEATSVIPTATLLNTLAITYLLYKQRKTTLEEEKNIPLV